MHRLAFILYIFELKLFSSQTKTNAEKRTF